MAYAQMALMTALLHDSLAAANPVTVIRSIARIGKGYVASCLVSALTCLLILMAWWMVLLHSPSMGLGLLGLWACWVFTLYAAMMVDPDAGDPLLQERIPTRLVPHLEGLTCIE